MSGCSTGASETNAQCVKLAKTRIVYFRTGRRSRGYMVSHSRKRILWREHRCTAKRQAPGWFRRQWASQCAQRGACLTERPFHGTA
jgi:hypothetical protein